MAVLQGGVYVAELVSAADLSSATVTVAVSAPDGSTVNVGTPTVSGFIATVPITASQVGVYLIVWTVSGAVVGSTKDQFTVVAPTIDLISLPDLKDELNITASDTSKDARLRRWTKSAADVVQNVTGPILPTPRIEWFNGNIGWVVLSSRWVASVSMVAEVGGSTSYTLSEQPLGVAGSTSYGYTWDRNTNTIVRRGSGGSMQNFADGVRNVSVAYTAGLSTVPDDVQLAAAELIKHWYRKAMPYRSGSAGRPVDDDGGQMVGNYMVPNAVMELLEAYRRPVGVY